MCGFVISPNFLYLSSFVSRAVASVMIIELKQNYWSLNTQINTQVSSDLPGEMTGVMVIKFILKNLFQHEMSHVMRKQAFWLSKTKTLISCAVTALPLLPKSDISSSQSCSGLCWNGSETRRPVFSRQSSNCT